MVSMYLFFQQFLLGVWAKELNAREDYVKRSVQGKLNSATQKQTESYLRPLFRKLRKRVRAPERGLLTTFEIWNMHGINGICFCACIVASTVNAFLSFFRIFLLILKNQ